MAPSHGQLSRKNIIFEELQRFSNPKGRKLRSAIAYFDMLYWSKMDDPDIYIYIYSVCWSIFLSSSLCCNSLSGVLFLEIKGDEMWSLYAEKLRLLAERFEEAPTGRLLDFWGGRWILGCQGRLMDIECLFHGTMDHSYNML